MFRALIIYALCCFEMTQQSLEACLNLYVQYLTLNYLKVREFEKLLLMMLIKSVNFTKDSRINRKFEAGGIIQI